MLLKLYTVLFCNQENEDNNSDIEFLGDSPVCSSLQIYLKQDVISIYNILELNTMQQKSKETKEFGSKVNESLGSKPAEESPLEAEAVDSQRKEMEVDESVVDQDETQQIAHSMEAEATESVEKMEEQSMEEKEDGQV